MTKWGHLKIWLKERIDYVQKKQETEPSYSMIKYYIEDARMLQEVLNEMYRLEGDEDYE